MPSSDFSLLERRINELIQLCDQLSRENHALKNQAHLWAGERVKLVEKNELAKTKVEAMIGRLKALEQE